MKVAVQFTTATFIIVLVVAGALIVLGQFGFAIQSSNQFMEQIGYEVQTSNHIWIDVLFVIYICSPAIASYIVLKKNNKITSLKDWLKQIFDVKCKPIHYVLVFLGIAIYFSTHIIVSGLTDTASTEILGISISNPFILFLLSIPGTLIIGGMEESGWMRILQPELNEKFGFIISSIFVGFIWILWHIPLFFIPGTLHHAGIINFWMFTFGNIFGRFFYGALHKVSSSVFLCVLFHSMFNAGYNTFIFPRTWAGAVTAYTIIFIVSITIVLLHDKKKRRIA